uniref:Box C/D snoRNA protein 1 n=1 Tax=Aegilops tauschii subsp. strangulata TaxID=200361 RepID=A0A453B061_AEGTS
IPNIPSPLPPPLLLSQVPTRHGGGPPPSAAAASGSGGGGEKGALCQECGEQPWNYRCPGCSRLTCSLPCVQAHKRRTACSGKRPRTVPVALAQLQLAGGDEPGQGVGPQAARRLRLRLRGTPWRPAAAVALLPRQGRGAPGRPTRRPNLNFPWTMFVTCMCCFCCFSLQFTKRYLWSMYQVACFYR